MTVSPKAIAAHQTGTARFQTWTDRLEAGRYAFAVDLQTDDTNSYIELKARVDGKVLTYFGGPPKWVADSYSDFILDLREPAVVEVETFDPAGTAAVRMATVAHAPVLGHNGAAASLFY